MAKIWNKAVGTFEKQEFVPHHGRAYALWVKNGQGITSSQLRQELLLFFEMRQGVLKWDTPGQFQTGEINTSDE